MQDTYYIQLNFHTNYRLHDLRATAALKFKSYCALLYLINIIKKLPGNHSVGIAKLPTKARYFTLVKGPKCHKVGKIILSHKTYRFTVWFRKIIPENIMPLNGLVVFNKLIYLYSGLLNTFIGKHRFKLSLPSKIKFI